MATRREELAEAATDYAIEHGLIGLSLRPLGDALGTSDRMLLYHFRDKDDLVATILRTSTTRSVAQHPCPAALARPALGRPRPLAGRVDGRPRPASASTSRPASLGLFGHEPYATEVREANTALDGCPGRPPRAGSGSSAAAARQAANLVDAAFMGLQLDQPLDSRAQQRRTVGDLADAVAARWGRARSGQCRQRVAVAARRPADRRPRGPPGSASRCSGSGQARSIARAGTAPSASRASAISRPRHWRSVPSQACPRRGGPSYAGWPARRQAQRPAHGAGPRSRVRRRCRPGRRAPSPRPTRWRPSARRPAGGRRRRPSRRR